MTRMQKMEALVVRLARLNTTIGKDVYALARPIDEHWAVDLAVEARALLGTSRKTDGIKDRYAS